MSSITLTLSGGTSELSANYFPPIQLDKDGEYMCGLVDFQTFMSIPNITEENNRFYYLTKSTFKIESGRHNFKYFVDMAKQSIQPEFREDSELVHYVVKLLEEAVPDVQKETESEYFHVDKECELNCSYMAFIEIPVGSYELSDIDHYLNLTLNKIIADAYIYITFNKNTLKSAIMSNLPVFFNKRKTFRNMLGFDSEKILIADNSHESDSVVNISSVNAIKIECNITSAAYSNDKLGHTLHEFYPSVDSGYKIVEVPQTVIYLPLTVHTIDNLTIRCVDQNNKLVNFRGETITLRVHIKKVK
jgi:hypothetical protein